MDLIFFFSIRFSLEVPFPNMTIYNFHIFDSAGNCLFSLNQPERTDQQKILYGFLYSLKSFTDRMTPILTKDNNFFLYSTSGYHLVFYELPTSLKFVIILSADVRSDSDFFRELLGQFYREVYVQYVVKNPMMVPAIDPVDATDNNNQSKVAHNSFDCDLFRTHLNNFFTQNNML